MPTHQQIDVPTVGKLSLPVGLFINNEWVEASDKATFDTVNPGNGQKITSVAHATKDDVDKAVKAARAAFKTTWGLKIQGPERGALLNKLADLLDRDATKVAAIESLDSGKGVRMAAGDVADSAACLRYYAGLADKIFGQTIDSFGDDKFAYTLKQPVGIAGQIIPWNYPLLMWAWKVGPALASGCCVVMKPSELTPLSALYMCELAKEAGFPAGVINTVPGFGATTGDAISRHLDIDKVAFTGSVITGRRISIAAAESNLKKVTLELGGKSPMLVFESSDLDQAADWTALGIWFNSGQDCCASSRVYVQESVYDKFIAKLKERAEKVAIGQPSDQKTSFGPLISAAQRDKVINYIEAGKKEGARVLTGGKKWAQSNGGFFVEPTILVDAKEDNKCVREEIFGPVIVAGKFKDEADALRLANDTTYGLAAAVFTNDASQMTRVTKALDAGTVWVNQYCLLDVRVPFGGFKQSGIGRELGTAGLEAYLETKAVHQNIGMTLEWPL